MTSPSEDWSVTVASAIPAPSTGWWYVDDLDVLVYLNGSGQLSCVATTGSSVQAELAGAGYLSAGAYAVIPAAALLGGVGSLSAAVYAIVADQALLSGLGTLSASALQQFPVAGATSGAGTLSASVIQQFQLAVALGGVGSLSAAVFPQFQLALGLGGLGTLAGSVYGVVPQAAGLGGVGSLSCTAVNGATGNVTATLGGTGTLSVTNKMSLSYTFSGTTLPSGLVYSATNGSITLAAPTVTGGVITEGDSGSGNNGIFYAVALWPDPTVTSLQDNKVTVGTNTTHTSSGEGAACAFDSAGTNGVIGVIDDGGNGAQIITKVGTTWTQRAVLSTAREATAGDVLEIKMSVSAGIYTYTLYQNGGSGVLSWTDSGGIITPGKYGGGAFQHDRVSGVSAPSKGLTNITVADA